MAHSATDDQIAIEELAYRVVLVSVQHVMDLLTFYLLGEILAVSMGVRQPDTPLRSIFTSGDESIPAEADHLQIEISHTHIHAKDALV